MINKDKWEKLTERMVRLHITETDLVEKFILGSGKVGQNLHKTLDEKSKKRTINELKKKASIFCVG